MQGEGDIYGRGTMHGGERGACMAGACVAWGACVAGGVCLEGETATAAAGTHPTRMHSCLK